jgi:HK97 family phage major capsid protein/HK97 family phage prohead protease
MSPHKGESQSDFMSRCMSETYGSDAPKDRTQEQAVAICYSYWRDAHGGEKPKSADEVKRIIALWKMIIAKQIDAPEIEEGETREDYIERCADEIEDKIDDDSGFDAEDVCMLYWEEENPYSAFQGESGDSGIIHKMSDKTEDGGTEFILSDATPDHFNDIIEPAGWSFENFKKNPICLFNHRSEWPIGTWKNIRIAGGELRGHLQPAPWGTSPRIDEVRRLIDAGILKAVSVGFKAIESKPRGRDPFDGMVYVKSELVECSLVSIPANPNALSVAKSLRISSETQRVVFDESVSKRIRSESNPVRRSGESANGRAQRRTGESAKTHSKYGATVMLLTERIVETQKELVALQDGLDAHLAKMNDSNVSDADIEATNDFNAKISNKRKHLAALQDSEKALADVTKAANGGANGGRSTAIIVHDPNANKGNGAGNGTIASPAIIKQKGELDGLDYLVRAGRVALGAKWTQRMPQEILQQAYGDDEPTRAFTELVLRAASAPAMTTIAGWAQELVQTKWTDLMPLLMPKSIFTGLSAKGLALTFGPMGRIIIPTRNRTPTIAGSFVGEGAAIPVRQGSFSSQTLVPKKMAVITTWTREMAEHSTPQIEGVLREAIQQDTSVAIDTVLIDANPATVIRPQGLLNGVVATTATAGGGLAALIGDITALISALSTNLYGNLRTPVWLMNQTDLLRASLAMAANTGIFPFRDEIKAGTLNTIPYIESATVPPKTMILLDAADFVTVGGEGPRLEISDQATLHFEDTTPLDLVSGSPGVVATPQKSLWQTDSLALRMIMPLNWVNRRVGTVAYTQNVTW